MDDNEIIEQDIRSRVMRDLNQALAKAPPPPDRITVLASFHHMHEMSGERSSLECRMDQACTTKEQPYKRIVSIPENDYFLAEYGWIDNPAWICIKNDSKNGARVVVDDRFVIRPGGVFMVEVYDGASPEIDLKAIEGPVTVSILVCSR